jgi:hypothetical protein
MQHEYLRHIREQQALQYARPVEPMPEHSRFAHGLLIGLALSVPAWIAFMWCAL